MAPTTGFTSRLPTKGSPIDTESGSLHHLLKTSRNDGNHKKGFAGMEASSLKRTQQPSSKWKGPHMRSQSLSEAPSQTLHAKELLEQAAAQGQAEALANELKKQRAGSVGHPDEI